MFSYACEAGPEIKIQVSMFASALNDEHAHRTINQALYVGSSRPQKQSLCRFVSISCAVSHAVGDQM